MTDVPIVVKVTSQGITLTTEQLDKLRGSVANVGTSAKKSGSEVGYLETAFKGFVGAFSVGMIAHGAMELGRLGESAEKSRDGLDALAGSTQAADGYIRALTNATDGSVSKMEATTIATRLLATGVADTAKEAAHFTEVAATLGATMGQSVTQSVEGLRLAIDNVSWDRLGELGLSTSEVRARVEELTEAGYKFNEAFELAVIAEAEERFRTLSEAGVELGTSTDRLSAAGGNLGVTIGTILTPALQGGQEATTGFLNALNAGLTGELDRWTRLATKVGEGMDALTASEAEATPQTRGFTASVTALNPALYNTALALEAAEQAQVRYTKSIAEAGREVANAGRGQMSLKDATDKTSASAHDAGVIMALARGRAAALATQAAILAGELYGVADGANAAGMALSNAFGGSVGRYQEGLERFDTTKLKGGNNLSLGSTGGGVRNIFTNQAADYAAYVDAMSAAASSGVSAAEEAQREQERIAKEMTQAWTSEFNRISGVARQQLNFSTSIGEFDALMDKFGYRDQNENTETARRLAAVRAEALQGKRSEWIDKAFPELSQYEGEQLAAKAQSVLEAYQKGLRPDLVNLDSLVAETREALLAESNLKGLQDEAAKRLMAEGFGADAIAKQFGESVGSSEVQKLLGESMGVAFVGAGQMASAELVDAIASTLSGAIRDKEQEWVDLGEIVGRGMRQGIYNQMVQVATEVFEAIAEAAEAG